jgi:transketolase
MRHAFAKVLYDLAESDERIVLMTADLGFMVLEDFARAFPKRFFNVGVAEANMIGLATGLAASGYIPFVYSIATFASMRGYEQLRNGPILHNLPVRVIGVGGGFEYGHAGFTHHALEDLAIARVQPGLTVVAPADDAQAANALRMTYDISGPIYYRMSKQDNHLLPNLEGKFRLGRIETVRQGRDLLILSIGSICSEALNAATILADKGLEATVAIISSLRPAPVDDLTRLLKQFPLIATIEEHYLCGGLGSMVSEVVAENGGRCRVIRLGIPDDTPRTCGNVGFLRDGAGLSAQKIAVKLKVESERGPFGHPYASE